MIAVFFAFISAAAAELGGLLAFKNYKHLNLTLGFTAGTLIGLVAFDLLPEIFEASEHGGVDTTWPMVALVAGFLLFHIIEKVLLVHHSHEEEYGEHRHPHVGTASAFALIVHSFLDGASIGVAFQIDNAAGVAVALAVIAHRFADGFNSLNLMQYHKNSRRFSLQVLFIVAVAPILGALSTSFFTLPEASLAIYLGFFAGFLLYIAASDILPQAHSKGTSRGAIVLTVLGAATMFAIVQLIGHSH